MPEAATLQRLIQRGADRTLAIVCPDESSPISYGDLAARVDFLARRLRAAGIEKGDHVAIVLPNGSEFLEVLLAVTALGAVAAPLNPAYTNEEFRFFFADIKPALAILPTREAQAAREALPETSRTGDLELSRPTLPLSIDGKAASATTEYEPAAPDDIAMLLHTSGTTSRPKQVPLLHRNLVASAATIQAHYALTPEDVAFCVMPLFHVHGLVASTFATLFSGGTVVVPRRVSPQRVDSQLRDTGATWLSAGPTLHHMILERAPATSSTRLRFLRSCSSALPGLLFSRIESHYDAPILEAYGMTEASHQIASNPLPPAARHANSVGIATGTAIRVVDAALNVLPDGHRGEVLIQGPSVTPGYLDNPRANAEAFVDGWFRTGDEGEIASGYLRLTGRLKEMIIRGGENISPYEIEDVLREHAAVGEAACFGVPDEKYGEQVGAAVSLVANVAESDLLDHCRDRLAAFKVPRRIHVLDEIPRTPTGKVQRKHVARLFADQSG